MSQHILIEAFDKFPPKFISDATPTQLTKQHKYEECYDVLKIELGGSRAKMHWLQVKNC